MTRSMTISIHAPRAGGDVAQSERCWTGRSISIHAPRAGGDARAPGSPAAYRYFNPRPPCGGRPSLSVFELQEVEISIHAPRAGGDAAKKQ